MRLSVVALDYDGTITDGSAPHEAVRGAIATLRARGVVVLLVTGRILDELRRVAGPLDFVDGVVAENGAVVHYPESGHTSVLAPRVSRPFVDELDRRGIPHQRGQCLVDAWAEDSHRLLDVIRGLELPLVQAFNRSRVMILPQGTSKASGLQTALDMLRLSARNTLAVGDAENDHELLRLVEVGAAVAWGSTALQAAADLVVPGDGPGALVGFLSGLAARRTLPRPARARRRLRLGVTEAGDELSLAVLGRNVLVAGDARSGKSWVAGLLCEQLILYGYCLCVIDPEGDYCSLEALRGVGVLGGTEPPPSPTQLTRALRYADRSVVIDLSRLDQGEKVAYVRDVLPALNEMRRRTGLPHRILIDEAHYFLHDAGAAGMLDFDLHGYTVVTYKASRLPPEVLAHAEVMIVTRESVAAEVDALHRACAQRPREDAGTWRARLSHLSAGQAIALPVTEESGGTLRQFTLGQRLTPHVRHREKYVDVPVAGDRAFVFGPDTATPAKVETLRELVAHLCAAPLARLDGHLRRSDFSRWIADVFGDRALAAEIARCEARFRASGNGVAIDAIVAAIRTRYDLAEEAADA